MNKKTKHLNVMPRLLRGNSLGSWHKVDATEALLKVRDITESNLGSIHTIRQQYQDGDKEGLASSLKLMVDGSKALVDAVSGTNNKVQDIFDYSPELLLMDITQLSRTFQPEIFESLAGHTHELLNSIEAIGWCSIRHQQQGSGYL